MREAGNIQKVEELNIAMMGFIFYPQSARYVHTIPSYLPSKCKRVGVFVHETPENIKRIVRLFSLDYVQLHGNESPDYCINIHNYGIRIIKAFPVTSPDDLKDTALYTGICDYYLFDTKCESYGGSGKQFDWEILHQYTGDTPFILSGGLDKNSVNDLRRFKHPRLAGYDLNSKFEVAPGLKNREQIKLFLENMNN